jgi:hypothetical protein
MRFILFLSLALIGSSFDMAAETEETVSTAQLPASETGFAHNCKTMQPPARRVRRRTRRRTRRRVERREERKETKFAQGSYIIRNC